MLKQKLNPQHTNKIKSLEWKNWILDKEYKKVNWKVLDIITDWIYLPIWSISFLNDPLFWATPTIYIAIYFFLKYNDYLNKKNKKEDILKEIMRNKRKIYSIKNIIDKDKSKFEREKEFQQALIREEKDMINKIQDKAKQRAKLREYRASLNVVQKSFFDSIEWKIDLKVKR